MIIKEALNNVCAVLYITLYVLLISQNIYLVCIIPHPAFKQVHHKYLQSSAECEALRSRGEIEEIYMEQKKKDVKKDQT